MWGINYGWGPKPSNKTHRSAFVCGLTTVAGLLVEIPLIGSGANPVRAMSSNLIGETWDGTEWVYVFGPIFGGVLGEFRCRDAVFIRVFLSFAPSLL
jgi:glycerol uptake facilitator-like aquaporin